MCPSSARAFCVTVALYFLVSTAQAQTPNPTLPTAGSNELPMYGGAVPSPEQKTANDQFIKSAIAMKGTPEAASDASVQLGFDYALKRHDHATAMKRFNQAYLLDPNNGAAYQGMAITWLMSGGDEKTVEGLFQRAAGSKRVNPDIFADYGRFLLQQNRVVEAIPVLQGGVALDQNYAETGGLLAEALYQGGRLGESCPLAQRWQSTVQPEIAQGLNQIVAVCKTNKIL